LAQIQRPHPYARVRTRCAFSARPHAPSSAHAPRRQPLKDMPQGAVLPALPLVNAPAAVLHVCSATGTKMANSDADQPPNHDQAADARTWVSDGWTARVHKNEDDEGWAVSMTRDGDSEPVLVSPW